MAVTRKLGPYSSPGAVAKIDGRTFEGKLLRDTRNLLIQHVGGSPSATQRAMIERCAFLTLRVALLDRKALQGDAATDIDNRTYIAFSNTLTRTLARLGPAVAAQRAATLADKLAAKVAGK